MKKTQQMTRHPPGSWRRFWAYLELKALAKIIYFNTKKKRKNEKKN